MYAARSAAHMAAGAASTVGFHVDHGAFEIGVGGVAAEFHPCKIKVGSYTIGGHRAAPYAI